ncbi:MAG: AMP-binding protein [Firmicutes bacterium]|nr:AMP-binding protein [Bacillota bacterium]
MARPTMMDILQERKSERDYLLTTNGSVWTYQTLYEEVRRRSQALKEWGIKKGYRIGLKIKDPGEFILWFLTVLVEEAVAVPINPSAPADDVQRTLDKSGSTHFFDGEHPPTALVAAPLVLKPRQRGAGVILLTSGSTGDPKPVGLSLDALWHTAGQVVQAHRLTPEDRGFSPLPLFHINALVVAVLGSLAAHSAIVIADGFHASEFWETVDRYQVTWINAVPSILMVLSQRPEGPRHPERIRFIRSASAPLPRATKERIEARFGIGVVETYGMTEAGSQITANPLPGEGGKAGSVGIPRGVEIRVVDEEGRELPRGSRGVVEIRGPGVIDPRWGPNQWARSVMHEGWYPTGDLGYLDEDGYLFLDGRSRDIINRGGEKIFPREVEEWLLRHPEVADCAVVGRPHPILGEEPVAFVVARDENALTIDGLDEWAEKGLARFKRPAAYFVVKSLPKGSTGKIARQDLRQRVREGSAW